MSALLDLVAKVKTDRNTPNFIIEVIVVAPGPPGEGPIEVERFLWRPAQAALTSERSENVVTAGTELFRKEPVIESPQVSSKGTDRNRVKPAPRGSHWAA